MPPLQKPSLFGRLLVLFTVVPILELALLVWMGQQIGFWPTVGLIAATAVLGSFLAHREGLSALARFRARLQAGGLPGDELTDGILILLSGALLLTPGVLTDLVGFLGLFPPTRAVLKRFVLQRIKSGRLGGSVHVASWGPDAPNPTPPPEGVIDVEYEEIEPRPKA